MATFLVAHGAWSAGWAWKKMRPLLQERGHVLHTPTYTGLGERAHLASRDVTLQTHIADVLGTLEFEDLRDVVLVGHSYGGMVATGVADRARTRLRHLVYLDAFVPRDGQSLLDLVPADVRERMHEGARTAGAGWRVPPNPVPPDTSEADLAWIMPRRVLQPLRTFEEPLRLTGTSTGMPRTYIYCTRSAPGDLFRQFADRARAEPGWQCLELDASHSPNVTAPAALAAMLDKLAG
ncbi:MAG TPA: alpha/beta hydrolase [Candidatus Acidoferrum sp.]|jgi:pimeloyl-ACP methyl ester carboxylesterase|nr:alpha/beta hydrolase [Candidatus Acidoferrum sp.]